MYRESQKNMKTIEIADFKKLVMERLANPRDYAGRSLVLWNADYNNYGIAYRVIKQCCKMYNKENQNDQVWFRLSDMPFINDDYTKNTCIYSERIWDEDANQYRKHTEIKRCGIIFNTGCYMPYEQEDWLKFVNTHTNGCGHIFQDCAVIVCAHPDIYPQRILKEEQFGNNCDIYSIQPTLEEWTKWTESFYDSEIIKVVRAYIEKNGVIRNFDYWLRIMNGLKNLKEIEGCSITQIPKEDVETKIMGAVSTKSPAPEFCDFIYEQDTSM